MTTGSPARPNAIRRWQRRTRSRVRRGQAIVTMSLLCITVAVLVPDECHCVVEFSNVVGVPRLGPARHVEHRRDDLTGETPHQHFVEQECRTGEAARILLAVHHDSVLWVDERPHWYSGDDR